jgi:hypothetical protein
MGEVQSASGSRGAAALKKRLSLSARAASQLPRPLTMDTACQRVSSGLAMARTLTPTGPACNSHRGTFGKFNRFSNSLKPTRGPIPVSGIASGVCKG